MLITEYKTRFKTELSEAYPKTEISSFFAILLKVIVGMSPVDLALQRDKTLTKTQQQKFEQALNRLKKQEPIQYIVGDTTFFGLAFKVNKNVLIPRPETEELVEWILQDLATLKSTSDSISIVDIGTGSGCIAVSLAKQLPQTKVTAVDVSEKALAVAQENARHNKVEVDFYQQDILYPADFHGKFDVVVSNPPYVRHLEKEKMQPNVLEHEPHLALFVDNDDALLFYRKILDFAGNHLSPQGHIYFEINEYLETELTTLFKENGYNDFVFKKDIYGKKRMVRLKHKE